MFGVDVDDSDFLALDLVDLVVPSVSDFRGLPRRRGVFSATGSDPDVGPFDGFEPFCCAGDGAGAALRFFGCLLFSSSGSCINISVPPMVEGVEDAAGRCCCNP